MSGRKFKIAKIRVISSVIPRRRILLQSLRDVYEKDNLERIVRATGISEIAVAEDGMTPSDYCAKAAEHMFSETGMKRENIDGLIYVSEFTDYLIPGTVAPLQNRLGLRNSCIVFDLRSGCPGFVYGVFQACMLVENGYCKNVLLCVGNTISKFLHPSDRALRMVSGDAASAILISACEDKENRLGKRLFSDKEDSAASVFDFYTDGSGAEHLMIPAGGMRTPVRKGSTDIVEYDEDGNGRTKENLHMNGMEIMVFATRVVPGLVEAVLKDTGWDKRDVNLFAFHQANKMMLKRIGKSLKVDNDRIPFGVSMTGNCGSPSIPLMLSNMYSGVHPEFKKVVICGFGAGLSAAAGTVDLSETIILPTVRV